MRQPMALRGADPVPCHPVWLADSETEFAEPRRDAACSARNVGFPPNPCYTLTPQMTALAGSGMWLGREGGALMMVAVL